MENKYKFKIGDVVQLSSKCFEDDGYEPTHLFNSYKGKYGRVIGQYQLEVSDSKKSYVILFSDNNSFEFYEKELKMAHPSAKVLFGGI